MGWIPGKSPTFFACTMWLVERGSRTPCSRPRRTCPHLTRRAKPLKLSLVFFASHTSDDGQLLQVHVLSGHDFCRGRQGACGHGKSMSCICCPSCRRRHHGAQWPEPDGARGSRCASGGWLGQRNSDYDDICASHDIPAGLVRTCRCQRLSGCAICPELGDPMASSCAAASWA